MVAGGPSAFVARTRRGEYWALSTRSNKITLTAKLADAVRMTFGVADDGRAHIRIGAAGWLSANPGGAAMVVSDEDVHEAPKIRVVVALGAFGLIGPHNHTRMTVTYEGEAETDFLFVDAVTATQPVFKMPKRFAAWSQYAELGRIKFEPMAFLGTYAIITYHSTLVSCQHSRVTTRVGCELTDALKHPDTHFGVYITKDFQIGFRHAETKLWLCAEPNGTTICNRGACNIWEQFTIGLDLRTPESFGLLSHHGKHVCAGAPGHGGGGSVTADRAWINEWERFRFIHVRQPQDFRIFGVPTALVPSGQVQASHMTMKQVESAMQMVLGGRPFALVACDANGVPHLNALALQPSLLNRKKNAKTKKVSSHMLLVMGDLAGTINLRKPAEVPEPLGYQQAQSAQHYDPEDSDAAGKRPDSPASSCESEWNMINDE